MKKYDNNIEMFDAYLNNQMSADDKPAFELRLGDDSELKREFAMHKEFVACLQDLCSEDDKEFGEAIRNISDNEFKKIVGERKRDKAPEAEEAPKKRLKLPQNIYFWMSAAAVVFLLVSVGNNFMLNSKLDNMKTAFCNQVQHDFGEAEALPGYTRDFDEEAANYGEALEMLLNNKSKQGIAMLQKLFDNASTPERKQMIGTQLVFAYITKAKDVDKAKSVLDELKKNNNGNVPDELKELDKDIRTL